MMSPKKETVKAVSFLIIIVIHLVILPHKVRQERSNLTEVYSDKINVSLSIKPTKKQSQSRAKAKTKHGTSDNTETKESVVGQARQQGLKDHYLKKLSTKIKSSLIYPRLSKRLREKGSVSIQFTILKSGKITEIEMTTPSKYDRLNQAAIKTIEEINSFLPIPNELSKDPIRVTQRIEFN